MSAPKPFGCRPTVDQLRRSLELADGWLICEFEIATSLGITTVCGTVRGGLGLHQTEPGGHEWLITHVASGHLIAKGFSSRQNARIAVIALLDVCDWSLDVAKLGATYSAQQIMALCVRVLEGSPFTLSQGVAGSSEMAGRIAKRRSGGI